MPILFQIDGGIERTFLVGFDGFAVHLARHEDIGALLRGRAATGGSRGPVSAVLRRIEQGIGGICG